MSVKSGRDENIRLSSRNASFCLNYDFPSDSINELEDRFHSYSNKALIAYYADKIKEYENEIEKQKQLLTKRKQLLNETRKIKVKLVNLKQSRDEIVEETKKIENEIRQYELEKENTF